MKYGQVIPYNNRKVFLQKLWAREVSFGPIIIIIIIIS